MSWAAAQDAVAAALVASPPDGWHVRSESGFPGMEALDAHPGGIVWVDDDLDELTVEGVMTGESGVEPLNATFPVRVVAYRLGSNRKALRDTFAALDADLRGVLLGAPFMDGDGIDLVFTGLNYKPGQYDERTFDGLMTMTFTWRG